MASGNRKNNSGLGSVLSDFCVQPLPFKCGDGRSTDSWTLNGYMAIIRSTSPDAGPYLYPVAFALASTTFPGRRLLAWRGQDAGEERTVESLAAS
jgi:hypothetical protein